MSARQDWYWGTSIAGLDQRYHQGCDGPVMIIDGGYICGWCRSQWDDD